MHSRSRLKTAMMLVAGFLAGVAFIIACGTRARHSGDSDDGGILASHDAEAQETTTCSQWEMTEVPEVELEQNGQLLGSSIFRGPDGWEPVSLDGTWFFFRRCVR